MRHEHLRRLPRIWVSSPVFFVTTCVLGRRRILDCPPAFEIIRTELATARQRHGWHVGPFVVMPDHLHFLCTAEADKPAKRLSEFVGRFKEWSAKRLAREAALPAPVWQREFFDHLLRSNEAYEEKAHYLLMNPVRAGLVSSAADWPYQGDLSQQAAPPLSTT